MTGLLATAATIIPVILKVLLLSLPILLPAFLIWQFFVIWQKYIRTHYIANTDFVLLEIKIPKEIAKSPLAMEVVLTSLYQTGKVTYEETYWVGKMKPWFSLEMVSLGGQVRFFIWTQRRYKDMIEAQIYGQYGNVEVHEVEDYTSQVKRDPEEIFMWGTHYKLTKEDVYPIKTYVDYKLEAGDEEEEKVDPMTSLIEFLGSMKKDEQIWIQILIKAHRKEGLREGRLIKRKDWKEEAEEELEKIRESMKLDEAHMRIATEGEKNRIFSIERSIDKLAFDCMIRGFYIAKNAAFDNGSITALIGALRQFNSDSLNGFKLGWYTDHSDNAKDWASFFRFLPGLTKSLIKRRAHYEEEMLEAYKMRSFFYPPYRNFEGEPFILTTEEIATIFHFPGMVASTPTLPRIPSKKAAPPPNLPV